MNGKVIDSNFILNVNPNWSYGLNHGFTYDQTGRIADDTYWEMERFYEKYRPHKWPEEKPEGPEKYLVRLDNGWYSYYELARWNLGGWKSIDSNFVGRDISEFVTHWWELPEVTE